MTHKLIALFCLMLAGCASPVRPHFIMYEIPAGKLIVGERWLLKSVYEAMPHDKPYSGGFYVTNNHTAFVEYQYQNSTNTIPNMEIDKHEFGHRIWLRKYYE